MTFRPLRTFTRVGAVLAATGLTALLGAGIASAHVTAQPGTAVKGSTGEIAFRVPNEDAQAGTVKLEVTLPLDHPIASVSTKAVPGWTAQVTKAKLPTPIKTDEGTEVTDAVQTITWTADAGTRIAPGQFQEFDILASTLPDNTDQLVMPATQTYDNGKVVRWDEQPAAPGAAEPEHPAPTVKLLGAAGSPQNAAPAGGQDTTARWLGGAGLLLGAVGFGVGVGAVLRGRRPGGQSS